MTNNQQKLLRFIADYRVKYGVSPTLQEMVIGISVSDHKSVSGIIAALIKKGFLEKGKQKTRAVLLTDKAFEFLEVPLFRRQKLEEFDHSYSMQFESVGSSAISILSSEYVGHGKKIIKTDGTSLANDLKTVIGNTATNIVTKVIANEESGTIFMWALLLTGLTWGNIKIMGDGTNALMWTVIESIIIKFIGKKITLTL